jgi:hypothetical protein
MSRDYDTLMLCALRYCHGRKTYMPSDVIRICKENWDNLSNEIKSIIKRDTATLLKDELRMPGAAGNYCDVEEWNRFYGWMEERMRNPQFEAFLDSAAEHKEVYRRLADF